MGVSVALTSFGPGEILGRLLPKGRVPVPLPLLHQRWWNLRHLSPLGFLFPQNLLLCGLGFPSVGASLSPFPEHLLHAGPCLLLHHLHRACPSPNTWEWVSLPISL